MLLLSQSELISYTKLSKILAVAIRKYSRFPLEDHSNKEDFYYHLINTTFAPTNIVITSLIYFTKLHVTNSPLLEKHPGTLLYVVCLSLAFSIVDEKTYTTKVWSKISGYTIKEINLVTCEILYSLDYCLNITPEAFRRYKQHIKDYVYPPVYFKNPWGLEAPYQSNLYLPNPNSFPLYSNPSMIEKNQYNGKFCPFP